MPVIVERVKARCTSCGDGGAGSHSDLEVLKLSFGYILGNSMHMQSVYVCEVCRLALTDALYQAPTADEGAVKFGPEPYACLEDQRDDRAED